MPTKENTAFEVPYGDVNTAFSKFLQALGKAGNVVVDRLKTNPSFARRLAKYAIAGTYGLPTKVERVKEIMGSNFIGMDVVSQLLGVKYTLSEQLAMAATVPYPEEDLLANAQSHLLVPGVNLTADQMYEFTKGRVHYCWDPKTWCWKGPHASKEIVGVQWLLVRKGAVPGSVGKSWDEQQACISYKEIVPRACEVFFAALMNFMVKNDDDDFLRRQPQDPFIDLRCADMVEKFCRPDRHAYVSPSVNCVHMGNDKLNRRYDDVGLASRLRLPSEI